MHRSCPPPVTSGCLSASESRPSVGGPDPRREAGPLARSGVQHFPKHPEGPPGLLPPSSSPWPRKANALSPAPLGANFTALNRAAAERRSVLFFPPNKNAA